MLAAAGAPECHLHSHPEPFHLCTQCHCHYLMCILRSHAALAIFLKFFKKKKKRKKEKKKEIVHAG